jgi:hypothetical protein
VLRELRHLPVLHHAGLVDHHDGLTSQREPPLLEIHQPLGQGVGGDPGRVLEALGGLAGERATERLFSLRLPGEPSRVEHRALAGPGIPADHGEMPIAGDRLHGGALLGRERQRQPIEPLGKPDPPLPIACL